MKGLVLSAKWEPRPGYQVSEFEKKTGKAIEGAQVWRHPKLELKEVPDPKPGPGQVLLRVKACGVCGSDVHFYETDQDDYILYPGLTKFPVIIGHEFSGEIVEVGPGPEGAKFKPGDRVTVEEMVWCGHCRPCRDGFPNHCENLEEIGFTIDGAMAEYIVVPAKLCWKVDAVFERYSDEELAWEVAATTEPTCVAYNGVFERAGGFRPGAYVAVYGAGPIGLGAIQLSKAAGAAKVIAFEVSEVRRKLAQEAGADYVYDPREVTPSEAIMEVTGGRRGRSFGGGGRSPGEDDPRDGKDPGHKRQDHGDWPGSPAGAHVPGAVPGAKVAALRCSRALRPWDLPLRHPDDGSRAHRQLQDHHLAVPALAGGRRLGESHQARGWEDHHKAVNRDP